MYCQDCEFFHQDYDKTKDLGKIIGECASDKIIYSEDRNPPSSGATYTDYEGYDAYFMVSEDFGCINFEQKSK
jgi:hypothetical protein